MQTELTLCPVTNEHLEPLQQMSLRSLEHVKPWLGEKLTPATAQAGLVLIDRFRPDSKIETDYGFMLKDKHRQQYVGFGFLNNINSLHKFCNLGYWVDSQATGQGYATLATKELILIATQQFNLKRIELVIDPSNKASIKVAEKAGCINEGLLKNRLWGEKDALMFAYCA